MPRGKTIPVAAGVAGPVRKSAGGRPRKFQESSRPITVTLPESALKLLEMIDRDRAQAIVKCVRAATGDSGTAGRSSVEVLEITAGVGLITVGPSQVLRKIQFLHLVEVAPSRYLLALNPGNDFKTLEIAIHDALDDLPEADGHERRMLLLLLQHVRGLRKASRVRMAEILLVSPAG